MDIRDPIHWLKGAANWIGIIAVIGTASWAIAQPMAEKIIEGIVQEEIGGLIEQLAILEQQIQVNQTSATIALRDLDTIKELQSESRADIKLLLLQLRGIARAVE